MKICFVILHYLTSEDTIECINSIVNIKDSENASIVIVDNASRNGSIEKVKMIFENKINIHFIINDHNLGFAQGNNKGYEFAKNTLKSEMIIVANNDVIFSDSSFISKLNNSFKNNRFHVLGPDILSLVDAKHQNPMEMSVLNKNQALIEQIRYTALYILSKVGVYDYIKPKKKNVENKKQSLIYKKCYENVILHGSCIVFSPLYITKMNYAFYPETFLYMEEMILFNICRDRGFKTYYDSNIKVLHKEDSSTNKKTVTSKKKREFIFKNILIYLRIYKKVISKRKNIYR